VETFFLSSLQIIFSQKYYPLLGKSQISYLTMTNTTKYENWDTRDNVLYIAKEAEKEGCQHERVTKKVQLMEDRIRALLKDGPQPIVSHYIAKPVPK
jgi:hypothetical protein